MIMADKEKERNAERGMAIFSECMAGMMYSDEEIHEVMSSDDAAEFIALRDGMVSPDNVRSKSIGAYDNEDDGALLLAAEDEENYR